MENILKKYYQLEDPFLQKQVSDFLDYLLKIKKDKSLFNAENYKKTILNVSVWNDEDLMIFDDISKNFNQWTIWKL